MITRREEADRRPGGVLYNSEHACPQINRQPEPRLFDSVRASPAARNKRHRGSLASRPPSSPVVAGAAALATGAGELPRRTLMRIAGRPLQRQHALRLPLPLPNESIAT